MLKSFCIKTNNIQIIDYLLNEFENIKLEKIYISKLKFKIYNNLIVHYKGKDLNLFYNAFSNVFSSAIINFYEKSIIKHIINCNYFYFNNSEQKKIFDIANNYIYNEELDEVHIRKNFIQTSCIEYLSTNKTTNLDGFVNFRLTDYIKTLDYVVDLAVNKFIIDKEYSEFIDLLKCYINSKDYGINLVHLVYQNRESTLLDEFKSIIKLEDSILNCKFLSDISFSSNDYTLNSLLTLLPQKICIHIVDGVEDEFINTLKLIFDYRICICNDCSICKVYKLKELQK